MTSRPESVSQQKKRGFLTPLQLSKLERKGWRIKDIVPREGLCIMWGPPGSGKSFAALDLACAVARGEKTYHGKRIRPGAVFYIAMEGNLQDRINAYCMQYGITNEDLNRLYIMHNTINFQDEVEVDILIAEIRACVGDNEVGIVIVDTLARSMPGGNENGSESMGTVIQMYGKIQREFNTCVLALHHCGKNVENGMRGHSSLLGATDAEIEIQRNGDDPIRVFYVGKQKDGRDHFKLFNFRLESIDLGPTDRWDEDATPIERDISCVIVQTEDAPIFGRKTKSLGKNERLITSTIREAGGRISRSELMEKLKDAGFNTGNFSRTMKKLHNENIVLDLDPMGKYAIV